ncbi:alpha-L-rhamnosidase [Kibdelosporangium phytohabitans]|uniref:alpha-L-rhamnosidase n=1 Tax=Kibdelosporangium phytohabitans TaxID=860235 RepID=A0A0N9HZJ6_9PSEU|nr:alpha-L-rhamnosidase [Kibdelosporangium phytohabitans]ALG11166.1 hydrolase [Kibdelosporangium phytohabitans]MBE1462425.1 alpha-L-rhamnosidase [Kibdelosporangium phytohabitans]
MEMNRRVFLRGSAVSAGAFAMPAGTGQADQVSESGGRAAMAVERTTVEYAETLLGTDVAVPRLSWVLVSGLPGARQTAYQVRVRGIWDSGKVSSAESVGVRYGGPPLRPRTRYEWQVRVWDANDRVSDWSPVRWWETGLLGSSWVARWIGAAAPEAPPAVDGASWIWSATAPTEARWFRTSFDIAGPVTRARIVATADDDFTLYIGGTQALHAPQATDSWKTALTADVTGLVRGGRNVIAAVATNRGTPGSTNPAGLLVRMVIDTPAGQRTVITGPDWKVAETEQSGWQQPGFDDSGWPAVTVLAPYGQGVWGTNVSVAVPEAPAPLLRKEFKLSKGVTKARLYISGLAYYEATVNGSRVGAQVLDPGFTDYDETVLYATHDVTHLVKQGDNALEVLLGRGFYGLVTPNVWNWHKASWHGEPRLLAQLEIEHPGGAVTTIASGPDWKLAESRTVTNSQYAGETYDAGKAIVWYQSAVMDAPHGTVRAQQHEPIQVVDTITPTVRELRPGVYIADMGRTMSGWTELTVRAPAGTVIRMQHGERLKADGTVQWENGLVPGRHQTDEYICGGTGVETWEPKFSYKGFRYVQVTGARPEALRGKVVQSSVPDTGTFRCSEPFFEQLDRAMRRTLRNNLHGIPTDTPMYEKNGWTGDAQLGAPVMMYAFGMARFLTKWINDLGDSQNDAGQLPVIVPSGGWGYQELAPSPEWTTVYPFMVREMYRIYGDTALAATHWTTLTRYLDWEIGRLRDNLAITALGDYLPPGYGGNPPEDTRLTATAYLYRALIGTAELGELLGHSDTAARYRSVAEACRTAFNATFLVDGRYRTAKDPDYRQTSNAIPLMFGLVPPGSVAQVVASLVADIKARGNHLNTGALGTSVLLRALTAHGHPDVAHAVATQRTYPSWGFWFDNGADTMWEMWHADSRSRDHYFQGTVVQWLYENVAGLRPGDDGYRRFTVKPDARVGVTWAQTSVQTVRGLASVAWTRVESSVRVTVGVPVGSSAEVFVPGVARRRPPGVEFLRDEAGFQVFRVPPGRWVLTGDVDHP